MNMMMPTKIMQTIPQIIEAELVIPERMDALIKTVYVNKNDNQLSYQYDKMDHYHWRCSLHVRFVLFQGSSSDFNMIIVRGRCIKKSKKTVLKKVLVLCMYV